jgi:hypothetical protein
MTADKLVGLPDLAIYHARLHHEASQLTINKMLTRKLGPTLYPTGRCARGGAAASDGAGPRPRSKGGRGGGRGGCGQRVGSGRSFGSSGVSAEAQRGRGLCYAFLMVDVQPCFCRSRTQSQTGFFITGPAHEAM